MNKRIHCRPSWTLEQRLAHYTRVDPISGCHLWQGAVNDGGYGTLGVGGRSCRAHRLAWSLKHGPIPPRMDICHRCDERRCINPDHLFVESHAANMADRGARTGRGASSLMRTADAGMSRSCGCTIAACT